MEAKEKESEGNKQVQQHRHHQHHPPLSNYGDPANRQFPVWLSVGGSLLIYALYLLSSMLPLILPAFCFFGLYLRWMPVSVLQWLATAVVLDFVIPLDNGFRPRRSRKAAIDRLFAEGGHIYFPARSLFLPTADELSKDKAYILAAWPHGLFGGGCHYGFCDFEQAAGFYPIYSGASVMKYVPFVRRFLTMLGLTSVTKSGLRRVLDAPKDGQSSSSTYPYNVVHLVVGGIHEMFYTPGSSAYEQIIISKRKGFVKLALQTGADILPMYSFGANQTYYRIFGPDSWLCRASTALRVSITPWLGRWGIPLGLVPYRIPVLTVTGHPFSVPVVKAEDVTDELVQKVHADFCRELRALFDTYKKVYVEEMGADKEWLTRELKFEDEQ